MGGGGAYLALRPSATQGQAAVTDSASRAQRRPDSVVAAPAPAAVVVAAPAIPVPSAASTDFGTIVLREVPRGATVLVDGRRVSSLQPQVQPGRHIVEISAPGYASFSSPIYITRGGRQALTARMQPVVAAPAASPLATGASVSSQPSPTPAAPQAEPPTPSVQPPRQQPSAEPAVSPDTPGQLTVGARPLGSATLDGSPIARWPALNLEVLPGTHRLTIVAPGFEDSTRVFLVRPGQTVRMGTIVLRRREGEP
jgi:hypothetical protein